ncbi:hypothetical protein NL676_009940 [Syzygium grande]|nr:hypothetical protein NL676_009940 [Syzygium grande]
MKPGGHTLRQPRGCDNAFGLGHDTLDAFGLGHRGPLGWGESSGSGAQVQPFLRGGRAGGSLVQWVQSTQSTITVWCRDIDGAGLTWDP